MARKRYVSHSTALHLSVEVDGKVKVVSFMGGLKANALHIKGSFSTSDKKLQKAMEENPFFNDLFYLESTQEEEIGRKENVKTEENNADAISYANKQDLYQKLQERLPNEDLTVSMTEKDLLTIAKKNDMTFVKEKQ